MLSLLAAVALHQIDSGFYGIWSEDPNHLVVLSGLPKRAPHFFWNRTQVENLSVGQQAGILVGPDRTDVYFIGQTAPSGSMHGSWMSSPEATPIDQAEFDLVLGLPVVGPGEDKRVKTEGDVYWDYGKPDPYGTINYLTIDVRDRHGNAVNGGRLDWVGPLTLVDMTGDYSSSDFKVHIDDSAGGANDSLSGTVEAFSHKFKLNGYRLGPLAYFALVDYERGGPNVGYGELAWWPTHSGIEAIKQGDKKQSDRVRLILSPMRGIYPNGGMTELRSR